MVIINRGRPHAKTNLDSPSTTNHVGDAITTTLGINRVVNVVANLPL